MEHRPGPTRTWPFCCALALAASLGLAGCGGDGDGGRAGSDRRTGASGEPALPAPEGSPGSVTGMPANPGPGTTPIRTVGSGGATADASGDAAVAAGHAGVESVDGIEIVDVQAGVPGASLPDDSPADAPPIIIVPEIPDEPVALAVDPRPGGSAATAPRTPVGTEAATESTTIVVESADDAGD